MDTELQRSYQVKKYLEKLGYLSENIILDYSFSTGKRVDVVVKKEKDLSIVIEVVNFKNNIFEKNIDIQYHPLSRKIQRESQEIGAKYFILTDSINYLWMKTGSGGRPVKVDKVAFKDSGLVKSSENESINTTLNHIDDYLRKYPITGDHLYDVSLILFTKLKKETDKHFDISEIHQLLSRHRHIEPYLKREYLSKDLLKQIIDELDNINLSNNKLIVLEYIDNLFLSNSSELYVPRWLSDFMIKILDPDSEENIIDLFARNGTITSSVYLNKNNKVTSYYTNKKDYYWIKLHQLLFLEKEVEFFFEPFLLYGETDFLVENSVHNILIIPPFIQKISSTINSQLFNNGVNDSTCIFIESALKAIKENGKVMVIVSDNFLSSIALLKAREYFLKESFIESIVSLPQETFKPYSLVKTSLITFVKTKSPCSQNTFFAAIQEIPKKYVLNSKKSLELNEILIKFQKFKINENFTKSQSGFVVNQLDGENLHFSKYLFLNNVYDKSLAKGYIYIPLKDLTLNIYRGNALRSDDQNGDIPYIGPASIRKMRIIKDSLSYTSKNLIPSKNLKIETNDILVNCIGVNRGKAAIVSDEFNNYYINSHIILINVNVNLVIPEYLAIILNSKLVQEQFYDQSSGSVIPSLNLRSFDKLIIPIPNFEIQEKTIQEFNYLTEEYNDTLNKLAVIESKLNTVFNYSRKEVEEI